MTTSQGRREHLYDTYHVFYAILQRNGQADTLQYVVGESTLRIASLYDIHTYFINVRAEIAAPPYISSVIFC